MVEGEELRKKPFQFSTPRQERIYSRLRKVGPGPASFYKDACRLMNEEPLYESTTHLVAHLLREIEGGLRQVLVSASSQLEPKGQNKGHESSVNAILGALEIPEDHPVAETGYVLRQRRTTDLRDAHTATRLQRLGRLTSNSLISGIKWKVFSTRC
jgi:hypothetical protein